MQDIIAVADIELAYEIEGRGEPLLFLHGFTGCGGDWRFIDRTLSDRWRVIAPDLRGHGRSTNPSRVFEFRDAARDVRELLRRLDLERIKAIGVSGGGITLMHMVLQDQASIAAMVLVSAPPYYPDQARAFMRAFSIERDSPAWAEMRRRHPRGDEQIAMLVAQGAAFADSHDDVRFTPEALRTIPAKTLIVFGDRDPLYPARLALELFEHLPHAALSIVPNGGHGPVFGEHAAPFVQMAEKFLKSNAAERQA
jgi:pimeloyl-ACP methyl ester carboxylesterase